MLSFPHRCFTGCRGIATRSLAIGLPTALPSYVAYSSKEAQLRCARPFRLRLRLRYSHGMSIEYLFVKVPQSVVPKTVGFEAVVSMELTEFAAQGWKVVTAGRSNGGSTPLEIVLERERQ